MPHNLGQIARRRFKQKMIMVIHRAVCVYERILSLRGGLKIVKELLPDTYVFEDRFALIQKPRLTIRPTSVIRLGIAFV